MQRLLQSRGLQATLGLLVAAYAGVRAFGWKFLLVIPLALVAILYLESVGLVLLSGLGGEPF